MASKSTDLRDRFLAWQCRLRQIAMREHSGRPSPGMRPWLLSHSGEEIAPALTVVLVPKQPEESTAFFRFQVQKSADDRDVRARGLAFLQGEYFQRPEVFSDRLVAVLAENSEIATRLVADPKCVLEFDQFRQRFRLPSTASELTSADAGREAAIWHNRIFNPLLPDSVRVLAFQPDWKVATAEP